MEKDKVMLEFENLKSQVNPHFLFNSFNSLMNIIEEDQELAVEYVEKLAQFFRNILSHQDDEFITLGEEMQTVEDYFFIHQQRYGHLVSLDINVSNDYMDWLIPPLTLQILIENAIKHNVISTASPLSIFISAEKGILTVSNKIARMKIAVASTGTGLQNIRNRYRILTGRSIEVNNGPEIFSVMVPLIKNDHENTHH